jgi:hypothetical protein
MTKTPAGRKQGDGKATGCFMNIILSQPWLTLQPQVQIKGAVLIWILMCVVLEWRF